MRLKQRRVRRMMGSGADDLNLYFSLQILKRGIKEGRSEETKASG